MPVSEAQKKASKKYFDNNYKQVKLSMPIKEAEMLEEYCKNMIGAKQDLFGKQYKRRSRENQERIIKT